MKGVGAGFVALPRVILGRKGRDRSGSLCRKIGGNHSSALLASARASATVRDEPMLRKLVELVGSKFHIGESDLPAVLSSFSSVSKEELDVHELDYVGQNDDPRYRQYITYIHIGERENMSLGVFVMPPNTKIPLHDHPGMTVFTKVLWGELEVQAYDINRKTSDRQRLIARKYPIDVTKDGKVRLLTAKDGNVHSFYARKWTAVFDLSVPPYDPYNGRPCNYYQEVRDDPRSAEASENEAILRTSSCPAEYVTMREDYTGVPI
mmetsp:Transcript_4557/g.13786  ORF Transcript_4557/g.13786 Transcript_4557/m.13786 type:complete len:264 (+) Transcript_4557:135-926(+)